MGNSRVSDSDLLILSLIYRPNRKLNRELIQVQQLVNSFAMKVAEIFCFFIDICLPGAAFLDRHGILIILHTLGIE